jgi:hypothetical protein
MTSGAPTTDERYASRSFNRVAQSGTSALHQCVGKHVFATLVACLLAEDSGSMSESRVQSARGHSWGGSSPTSPDSTHQGRHLGSPLA